ncbi:MAG: DUF2142 domain-containing protein [Solirubrobacteraceae bacterium]
MIGSRHALLAAGLALLVLAWVFANPPGAAPDERAHYVRALGAGGLQLAGTMFEPTEAQTRAFFAQAGKGKPLPGAGVATVLWAARQTRAFDVPLALSATTFGCNDRRSQVSAACLDQPPAEPRSRRVPTYTGTYAPFAYIVPGAAMRTQATPAAALRAGRLVSALGGVALLIAALALTGGGAPLAGMAVALTPMVVYCAAILNASGPEIAGSVCFIAAGLRLQRPGAGPWAWGGLATGGAALTVSRSLGPVLLVVLGTMLLVLSPRRPRTPQHPRAAVAAGAALLVAFGVAAWWDIAQQPHGVEGGPGYRDALAQSFHDLDDIARHAVGNFGALDTPLPSWLSVTWALAAAGLFGLAAVRGSWRERAGLAAAAAVALGMTLVVSVFQLRTGYGAQGRHVLPVLVLVPLFAGEVLRRRPQGLAWLPAAAGVLWATGQAVAWLANARRAAVGTDGSWWFFGAAEWSPPGGWWVWAAAAAAGAALGLAGFSAGRLDGTATRR